MEVREDKKLQKSNQFYSALNIRIQPVSEIKKIDDKA